jgi:chorismate mutase
MKETLKFYMVREDILPDSIHKTALAKEMLASGAARSINEAVGKLGIARSTFYKYKEGVYSFFDANNATIVKSPCC